MLKSFEVKNFKGFKEKLSFDLTAGDYTFNDNIIKNGIVNKTLIYGKNNTGKSNIGFALFDIISHLTDKEHIEKKYLIYYANLLNVNSPVWFKYLFMFDNKEVIYEYAKTSPDTLVFEKLSVDGNVYIDYNFADKSTRFINNEIFGNITVDLPDNRLSVLKYVYRSLPTDTVPIVSKLMRFAENMLWYRSLSEGNDYAGFTNGVTNLTEKIYELGKLEDFKNFLHEHSIDYNLEFEIINGKPVLFACFGGNRAEFYSIASTGTKALLLYYSWLIMAFDEISLLFIDEFDAFFHYESAENLVKRLNGNPNFQTILTTHNTYLMKNELTRPDCCYILSNGKIKKLCECTDREILEAHNLEKMYINGAFCE